MTNKDVTTVAVFDELGEFEIDVDLSYLSQISGATYNQFCIPPIQIDLACMDKLCAENVPCGPNVACP